MRRRLALVLPALLAPALAVAQVRRPRRIGFLATISAAADNATVRTLTPIWRRLGFVEGQTLFLRSAGGEAARLPGLVEELLRLDISVIIANGAEAVATAARGTRSVPIVAIDLETDPVAAGLVESIPRPGRNVTGIFLDQPSMAAKWLDLLREVAPAVRQVVLLWDRSTGPMQRAVAEAQARERGLATHVLNWRQIPDFDAAFAPFDAARTGVVMLTAQGYGSVMPRLGPALLARRLPCIGFLTTFLGNGVLMTYGPDQPLYLARVMQMVENILAGENPSLMPVERPVRFRLGVDRRVADQLGLSLSTLLLAQADEVLE